MSDKPIRVEKLKGKHRREMRVFARNIHEVFCIDPKCQFKGQHAVQGVCYSDKGQMADFDKIDKHERELYAELDVIKKKYKGKRYAQWLESMYVCAMMNWQIGLDEVIKTRRDIVLLRAKAKVKK